MDDCNSLAILTSGYYPDNTAIINEYDGLKRRSAGFQVAMDKGNGDQDDVGGEDLPIGNINYGPKYILKFYTNNLIPLHLTKYNEIYFEDESFYNSNGNLYFKALYLKNKNVLFSYISNEGKIRFALYKIDYTYGGLYSQYDHANLHLNIELKR